MHRIPATALAASLTHSPGSIPMVVNGHAVTALEPIRGHVVHLPDAVRIKDVGDGQMVDALAIRFGVGAPMSLGDVRETLRRHGDLEVFVWGRRVDEIRFVRANYDYDAKRHVIVRDPGVLSMVATPLFRAVLPDGTPELRHQWAKSD